MKTAISIVAICLLLLAEAGFAARLPAYYPKEGFQRTGSLDAIYGERQRIVIDDVPYLMSGNMVVHGLSAYSVPVSQLQPGIRIGYKLAQNGRMVTNVWLLPANYRERR